MSQPVTKVPLKEQNTHKQGRSGSKVLIKTGPAVGGGDRGQKGKGRSAFTKNKPSGS